MKEKIEEEFDFLEVEALSVIWDLLQSDEEKEHCHRATELISLGKGDIVYNELSSVEYVYFLKSGKVHIYREGKNGRMYITRLVREGQFFGLRSFLSREAYTSTVEAHTDIELYRIKASDLAQIIEQNNKVCRYFLDVVVEEMNMLEERTIFLTQKYTRGRLADTLLLLISYYGFKEDGQTLDVYLSRQRIGELSNMTTSNVIRTLSDFAKEGILKLDNKQIKVLNLEGLEHISKIG